MNTGFRIALPSLVAAALTLGAVTSQAAPDPSKLSKIQTELERAENEEQALARKAGKLDREIKDATSRMMTISSNMRAAERELNGIDGKLKDLTAKRRAYLETLDGEQEAITNLVLALSRMSSVPPQAMLARPEAPIETARGAHLVGKALPALDERARHLRLRLDELAQVQADIETKQNERQKVLARLSTQEDELSGLIDKRRRALNTTQKEREAQKRAVEKLAEQARDVEDLMKRLETARKAASEPPKLEKLVTPVVGRVQTAYGEKNDLGAVNKGVTYSARAGSGVVSPFAGTVRFAGPFQKYKQILIIEHGDAYHSLIAGLGRIDTSVGAVVRAGEPVAVLPQGQDPEQTLYYELRRNGKPVNPTPVHIAQGK